MLRKILLNMCLRAFAGEIHVKCLEFAYVAHMFGDVGTETTATCDRVSSVPFYMFIIMSSHHLNIHFEKCRFA